jgi:diguanylate cyclase (GGDEF)-like protein
MVFRRIRSSLLLRTTLVVLGAVLVVCLVALALAGRIAYHWELGHQREAMEAQLDGVESLASAACFAEDRPLAEQIVNQLVATRSVQTAILRTQASVLAQANRAEATLDHAPTPLSRAIRSPFFKEVQVGELVLVPDFKEAERLGARTANLLRAVVLCLAVALGLTLALVVQRTIIRPISSLSDRLHRLNPEKGILLSRARDHDQDEIGQLAQDVNAILERLMMALRHERDLGEQLGLDQIKMQSLIQNVGTGIFLVNPEGTLEAWTPALLRMLGLENMPLARGAEIRPLFESCGAPVGECLARCRAQGSQVMEVFRVRGTGGDGHRWLQLCLDPIEKGWIQGLLEDVTSFRNATEAAQQLALRDSLTGVLNRLGAEQALADRFARKCSGLALIMLDLDHFKEVNDTYGHEAGDEVLRQVAARLETTVRRADLVARLGGDEFIIILEAIASEADVLDIAQKLITAINLPIHFPGGGQARVGGSLGIVLQDPSEPPSRLVLLKRADMAMYQAKQAGRNCARLFRS